MTNDGSTTPAAGPPTGVSGKWWGDTPPADHEMLRTGAAAEIMAVDARTVERWIDSGKLDGGRPRDPITHRPIKGSHRWADARHVVALAAGKRLAHRVPEPLRYLLPATDQATQTTNKPAQISP